MSSATRVGTVVLLLVLAGSCAGLPEVTVSDVAVSDSGTLPDAPACTLMPPDTYWYAPVEELPVHPRSQDYVASIGLDEDGVFPEFGSGLYEGGPIGIPYVVVPGDQERVDVSFLYDDESDPGPYPIPPDALIEGGPDSDGDRHVLVVDRDACVLYELWDAHPEADGSWGAGSGAVFDLRSHQLRPDTWTSGDAAGLPILPGLVRYDEVAAGSVDHAIRITVPETDTSYVWPARHQAGTAGDPSLPPMGLRLRLRADVDISGLGPQAQPIAQALKTYGAIVADNGAPWFITGVPDERWDNDDIHTLRDLPASAWEAVDGSSLMVDPDSARVVTAPDGRPRTTGRLAGLDRIATSVAISQRQFSSGAPAVYLANAGTVVDAVAGGVLTDGPVLLVPRCGDLPQVVADEIARLDPSEVLALGGDAAVCEAMLIQAGAVE